MNAVKSLLFYLIDFSKNHFSLRNLPYVTLILFLLVVGIYFSDYDEVYIRNNYGNYKRFGWVFFIEAFPFLLLSFSRGLHEDCWKWLSSSGFWFRLFGGFGILSYIRSDTWHYDALWEAGLLEERFLYKLFWRLEDMALMVPLLLLFYFLFDRHKGLRQYGLGIGTVDWKPYVVMLAIMFLIVGAGSFMADLQEYYPRYLRSGGTAYAVKHGFPVWLSVVVYEVAYAMDFISVELFFRGFLVLSFARYLGGHAVIAMVGAYVSLHTGKPMTEMVSSAFGGYILGVVTYHSRSIWGGIVVHVGVAWAMEFFGYLHQ